MSAIKRTQATGLRPAVPLEQQDDEAVLPNQIKQFYECLALFVAYPTATIGRIRTHGKDYEITLIDDSKDISERSLPVDGIRDYFRQYKTRDVNAAQQLIAKVLFEWSLVESDDRGNTYRNVAIYPIVQDSLPGTSQPITEATTLLKPVLSDWFSKNIVAEDGVYPVQFSEMSSLQEIESAKKAFSENARHLTAADWKVLAAEAERRATANKTVADLARNPDRPMLYRDRPRGQDLVTFLRAEYKEKGFLTPELNRGVLGTYDPHCLKAIEDYEQKRSLLPDDVSIPKLRARRNFRQRQPL